MRRVSAIVLVTALLIAGAAPATALVAQTDGVAADDVSAATEAPATTNGSNNATTLTVLTYNDIQTAAVEDGNFPRLVHLIHERRAAHDNPVVVAGAGNEWDRTRSRR